MWQSVHCKAHPTTARIPRSSSLSSHLGVRKARNQKSRSPERRLLEVGVWRAPRPPVFVNKWSSCALQSGWQWLWRWVAGSASAWIYRTTSCRASFKMQQRPELQNVTDMMDIYIRVIILQLGAKIGQNQAFLERFMQLMQAFRVKTWPSCQHLFSKIILLVCFVRQKYQNCRNLVWRFCSL